MGGLGAPGGGGGGGFGGRGGGRGGGAGWPSGRDGYGGGEATEYVSVPANKTGLVIGKGGETIKSINAATGAHCEVDKNAPPDAREKTFILRGAPDAVERAKQMICEKVGMGPGGGYGAFPGQTYGGGQPEYGQPQGGGGGYQQQGQAAPQINPTTGQPDYSQQWAEYYRSLGMSKEAEMIEVQSGGPGQVQQPQPQNGAMPGGPGGGGTPDYSAQWAEYYRSIGKHKEAEAIEAQMRAKTGSVPAQPQPGYPAPAGTTH